MSKQDKDILLATKPLGFDKKKTMDYIEKIQLENEGLKRQVEDLSAKQNALLKENAMLRARLEVGERAAAVQEPEPELEPEIPAADNYGSQISSRIQHENLADLDAEPTYEMPYETAGRRHIVTSDKKVVKKDGKTYISSKK